MIFIRQWLILCLTFISLSIYGVGVSYSYYEYEHRFIGNVVYALAYEHVKNERSNLHGNSSLKFLQDLDVVTRQVLHIDDVNIHMSAHELPDNLSYNTKWIKSQSDLAGNLLSILPATFGDLSSLAGDHAGGVSELHKLAEKLAGKRSVIAAHTDSFWNRLFPIQSVHISLPYLNESERIIALRNQWMSACRWYHRKSFIKDTVAEERTLADCFGSAEEYRPSRNWNSAFHREITTYGAEQDLRKFYHLGSEGYIRTRNELSAFERLPGYTSLASENRSHFPKHSWRQFLYHHREALSAAKQYSNRIASGNETTYLGECNTLHIEVSTSKQCLLLILLLQEGMAQHFLHDSFSSGHIAASTNTNKAYLQDVHDTVNEYGLHVAIPSLTSEIDLPTDIADRVRKTGWVSYGDGYLLIPEAKFHRTIVIQMALSSLLEVFTTAYRRETDNSVESCNRWKNRFPIPKDPAYVYAINREDDFCGAVESSWDSTQYTVKDLISYDSNIGSPDPRVTARPLEGWKLFSAAGISVGRFDTFQANGEVLSRSSWSPALAADLGYVRTTEPTTPNYLGVGLLHINDIRTSWYASVGYFTYISDLYFGVRLNLGFQVAEPFTEQNRNSSSRTSFEVTIPGEIGFRIYPPFTFFVRFNYLDLTFRGLGGAQEFTGVTSESVYVGTTPVFIGLSLDLAGVL